MTKKDKIIYGSLIVIVIITIILSIIVNNKNKGHKICTMTDDNTLEEWKFDIKDDEVNKLYIKLYYPIEEFGYNNANNLTEENKQKIQKEILYDLGVDKTNYDGINIKMSYSNDNVIVEINIDYKDAKEKVLKPMSLSYNKNIKFSSIKPLLEKDYKITCE